MRTCARARDLFGPYWDDEVTQAEREWLEAHFATCSACRESYEQLARTLGAVASLPRAEVPPEFAERTLAVARRAATPRDVVFVHDTPAWVPLAAAAGALLVLALLAPRFQRPAHGPSAGASAPVAEPRFVAVGVTSNGSAGSPGALAGAAPAARPTAAQLADSLFRKSEDVDFILDPVTLHRGRARTLVNGSQQVQGGSTVITF